MADRFHVNCVLGPGEVTLEGAEAHHLSAVCRARTGTVVTLFNGDGREYPARVTVIGRRQVTLEVLSVETPQRELGFRLEIAAVLPKGDRAQLLVEKLTELGVTTFIPLHTTHSVVHPREAKLEKLQRHVIEASKQCGRNLLMRIEPMATWAELVQREGLPERKLVAHPTGTEAPLNRGEAIAAIGPEGGFTDEEVEAARVAGWQVVGLGPRVLRIETAAMMVAVKCG